MAIVEITGWKAGFKKVSHTKALQELAGLSLSEAKATTDRVLMGECVLLEISAPSTAEKLAECLGAIGAVAKVIS